MTSSACSMDAAYLEVEDSDECKTHVIILQLFLVQYYDKGEAVPSRSISGSNAQTSQHPALGVRNSRPAL